MLRRSAAVVAFVAVVLAFMFPFQSQVLMFRSMVAFKKAQQPAESACGRSASLRAVEQIFRSNKLLPTDNTWASARKMMDGFPVMIPPNSDVVKQDVYVKNGPYPVKFVKCTPPNARKDRAILYFHGGGMMLGEPRHEFGGSDTLALESGATTFSVDYRLLPDVTAEQSVSDMVTVYRWLLREGGYKPEHVIITGCSGGGMAALLSALQIVHSKLPNPAGVVSMSPGLGLELLLDDPHSWKSLPSVKKETEEDMDALVDVAELTDEMLEVWLHDSNKPYVLNLLNNAKGLGKFRLQYGDHEMLTSINEILGQHLKKQGVELDIFVSHKCGHCYALLEALTPEGRGIVESNVKWMNEAWGN